MPNDKEVLFDTMRTLDKRVLRTKVELWEVAKLYNVKARVHASGILLRTVDKHTYNQIRKNAVLVCVERGGATTEGLCAEIEAQIQAGRGLGKKTYIPSRTPIRRSL